MFAHIDTLLRTIYSIGGDHETENLNRLTELKNLLKTQMELISRGIFIIRPEIAAQTRNSLLQFFQYGEALMSRKRDGDARAALEAASIPQSESADESSLSSDHLMEVPEIAQAPEVAFEEIPAKELVIQKRIQKKKKLILARQKVESKVKDDEDEIVPSTFAPDDFPALERKSSEPALAQEKVLEPQVARLLARTGNQKQRRDDKKERMGVSSIDEDSSIPVEDLSIPRQVAFCT